MYFGRNLDWSVGYGQQVVVTGRQYELESAFHGKVPARYAVIGMGIVEAGIPLFFDCGNEAGLAVAGLNFPGYADFEAADGIIIASPVYNMSFPAPMKAILDRMQRYYSARFFLGKRPPIAKRRPVALLLSAGSPDEDGAMIEKQLGKIFTVTNCELLCRVTVNNTDNGGSIGTAEGSIAQEAAYFAALTGTITNSSQDS